MLELLRETQSRLGSAMVSSSENLGSTASLAGLGGAALGEDVADIFPLAGADSAVAGEEDAAGSALVGKSPVRKVVLAEHLDLDTKLFHFISSKDVGKDVVRLAVESKERDVQQTHPAVSGSIFAEFSFMVRCHHGGSVHFPGVFCPGIFLEKNQRVFHPVDLAEMANMDTPSPGVVMSHGEEMFAYLRQGRLGVAPH